MRIPSLLFVLLSGTVVLAQTNPAARSIPFVEPFPSGTFSTYATGFQGWNGLSAAAITTQALAEASVPTGNATITATNPTTASVAGIYGSNGRVVLRSGSDATNGVNQLAMAINTTGQSGVRLSYSVTSVLAGPVTMGVVCQFRLGTAGGWTTLTPATGTNPYVQTSGFSGLKTVVGILLPVTCNNQPVVQVRWAVWRGTQAGNSAAFGIDDVAVTLLANDECTGTLPNVPLQDPGLCPANAIAGTTVGATDSGTDCGGSTVDVWYTLTADNGAGATIQLVPGTATGLGIELFNTCGGFTAYCQTGNSHAITLGPGNTYRMKVFSIVPGTFTICAVRPPANNVVFFATPLPSQHPDSCTALQGTTTFATNDGTIPCGLSPSAADVWYAVDGGTGFAVNIQLFPGSATDMGVQVFSDNGSTPTYCGTGNFHSFQVFGTNYRVKVFAGGPGTFGICAIRAPANNESFGAVPLTLRPAEECSCILLVQGTCPIGETADCNGNCAPMGFIGNFICDDGSTFYNGAFISFNCPAFGSDGGDCSGGNSGGPPVCGAQIDSTVFATNSGSNCAFPTARDLWYSITGTSSNTARIELFPITAANLGIEVFDGGSSSVYCAAGNSHGFFLPNGETYKVKVFTGTPGAYHICAVQPPTNDEQFTAAALTLHPPGTCTPLSATLAGTTNAFPLTSCALPGSVDVWYTVTGGLGSSASIVLTPGTATNMGIQVFNGQGGTETYCAFGNTHNFPVPFGSTYYVKVFGLTPGTFTLCATAGPENNEQFGATPILLQQPGTCTPLMATTAFATNSGSACSSTQSNDVWFTVTGDQGMAATIELTPITASALGVQVLNGQGGTETYCGSGNTHSFQVPFGSTYYVKVFAAGTQGTFSICAIAAPDNNENFFPTALSVQPTGTCIGVAASTTYATNLDPNCEHPTARDLWYTVVGPVDQTVTVELVPGTAADMGIEVFEDQFGSIGAVTYCAGGNTHTFNVPFGSSRFVKVFAATPGTFTICATQAVVECQQNGDCNDNDPCTIDACIAQECVAAPLITIQDVVATPALVCVNGNAQVEVQATTRAPLSQYVFSTETGATLDPMSQSLHRVYTPADDDPMTFPTTIGFDFPFNATLFSHFSVSPDGWLQLGGAQAVAQPLNSTTSVVNTPKIYAYWDDLATGGFSFTGGVLSKVSGTAPDRILKVQWGVTIPKNMIAVANSFFQVWLYENGTIEFRYGAMGSASMSASAGITVGPADFQSITLASNTVSTVSVNDANTGQPANGRLYRFSLPPVTGAAHLWTPSTFLSSNTAASPLVTAINVPEQEYDVVVTTAGGCTATDSVTVFTTTPTTVATITGTPAFCAGGSTTLTAVPSGGGGPLTYLWSPGSQTTASIVVSTVGTYSCLVSDPCGNVNAGSVNVIEKPVPSASASSNSPLCFGQTLLLDGSTDFGTTFNWTGPTITGFTATTEDASAPSVNGFFDDTFTFTASFNGCTSTPATVEVVVNGTPQMPTPTATPSSLCAGGNSQLVVDARENPGFLKEVPIAHAPLSGTIAAITTWNAGGDNTANDGFSPPIALPFNFKYDGRLFSQLWVSPNGYLTFNDPASVSALSSGTSAFLTLSSTPNAVVALCWSNLNATSGGSIGTFTVGAPGSRVFVVDFTAVPFHPNTGAMSGQIHLHETTGRIELHLTTVSHGSSTAENRIGVEDFNGGSRTVISKFPAAWNITAPEAWRFDPLTFLWSPTTFLNDPTIANPVATAITATTAYTITVTTPSGCITTRTVTVSNISPVSSALISGIPALCDGAPTTLTAVPTGGRAPFSYLWSPGNQTTASISVSALGTFSCQVGDACGGSVNTGPLTLVSGSVPTANASSTGPVCEDQTLNLIGTTNFGSTFTWTGPNGFASTQQNPSRAAMTIAEEGVYRFTAFSNGCPSVPDTVNVLVHPAPIINAVSATPNAVCLSGNSQLNVAATADRSFVRISEVTTQRTGAGATPVYPAYLSAGIDDFVELNNTSGFTADISGWTLASYVSNSTILNHPIFTFPPGTVIPANSALVVGMGPGAASPANQYYVAVSLSGNPWTSSGTFGLVLKNNTSVVVDAVATGTSFVWAPATGVTALDWTNTTLAALSGRAGIIRTASSDTNLGSDWSNANTGSPVQSIGTFNAGYTNPYLSTVSGFAWSPTAFLNSATIANPVATGVTTSTTYTVTVSSNAGCIATGGLTLNTTSGITAATISGNLSICTGETTDLTAVPTDGGSPFTYLWSPGGQTTASITVNASGAFSCEVGDACGGPVQNTGSATVVLHTSPTATATSNAACLGQTLYLNGATDTGTSFTWSSSNGFSSTLEDPDIANMTAAENGAYTFTATTAFCSSSPFTVNIAVSGNPVITGITATQGPICPGSPVQLQVSATAPINSQYCVPTMSDGCGFPDLITHVSIAGINRASTCDDLSGSNGYSFFTAPIGALIAGSGGNTYSVTTDGDVEGAAAWIDYDQDGVFETSENVFNGVQFAVPATYAGAFSVPVGAFNGPTRIRVRCIFNTNPGAAGGCTSGTFGETEDYTVTITGGVDPLIYSWDNAQTLNNATISAPIATPLSSMLYTVSVQGGACSVQANTMVNVPVMDDDDVCTLDQCANGVVTHTFQDADADGVCDANDGCPNDVNKIAPGICGCGVGDVDTDTDGTADCIDGCPNDINKIAPGQCGCGNTETDTDSDGTADCNDLCPIDPLKIAPGQCGCGNPDTDTDSDGTADCNDLCPLDANKTAPGICGCGVSDLDTDVDGTADCVDLCPLDANKTTPGICGCGVSDLDTDMDATADCIDGCPNDINKIAPGQCGCGNTETDTDSDGTADCNDQCPIDPVKIAPGQCGCGITETDTDSDGTADCNDLCPIDANKTTPGICGCGVSDVDTDTDGTADCIDGCPNDINKVAPGQCGCGITETDTDSDGTADCNDLCPIDANKTAPGICGCGVSDVDTDVDGMANCDDNCPNTAGQVGSACDDGNANTGNDVISGSCVCTGTPLLVNVSARVFLEGPYVSAIGLMNDALRTLGTFPTTDPYPGLGYVHTGSGNGGSIAPAVLAVSGNDAVVDWVLLELRNTANPVTIMASRSALVQSDGDVVDLDGTSAVAFSVASGSYQVAIRHRNHLGCMTNAPFALSASPATVDLTLLATATFGTNARKTAAGAIPVQLLWAGDVTFNGTLQYIGLGNDRDPILVTVGSTTPNNVLSNAYSTRDVNMDGNVQYIGSGNDRDPILVNVGSTTPNNVRTQQLP